MQYEYLIRASLQKVERLLCLIDCIHIFFELAGLLVQERVAGHESVQGRLSGLGEYSAVDPV